MKKVFLLFFLLFTASINAQVKIDEMRILRKNIFWEKSLKYAIPDESRDHFSNKPQITVDTELTKKFENILNYSKRGGGWRMFFGEKVKNIIFNAELLIDDRIYNFLITENEIYDLSDHHIYTPDSTQLKTLQLFIQENKSRLDSISYRWNRLDQLCFTPDGVKLVAWCDSRPIGSIRIWSALDGSQQKIIPLERENQVAWLLAINGDGTRVGFVSSYFGGEVDSVFCYSLIDDKYLWKKQLSDISRGAYGTVFSEKTGDFIVINYAGIHIYDPETGDERALQSGIFKEFTHMSGRVNQNYVSISPSGKYAAAWQSEGFREYEGWFADFIEWTAGVKKPYRKLRVWDIEKNKQVCELDVNRDIIMGNITFTSDSENFVFKGKNGKMNKFSIEEKRISETWTDTTGWLPAHAYVCFSKSNKYMGALDHVFAYVWDCEQKQAVKKFKGVFAEREDEYKFSYPMVFSPDEKYFAMEYYGELRLYDVNTFEPVWSVLSWPEDNERIWTDVIEKN